MRTPRANARPYLRLVRAPGRDSPEREAAISSRDVHTLYVEFAPYVAAIGHRILGSDDDVDDLIQDVFLRVHCDLATLRTVEAFRGWLAILTVRIARRKLRKRRIALLLGLRRLLPSAYACTPSDSAEYGEILRGLYERLDELPVDQRIAWTLRRLDKRTLDDVARLCHCSLATAKRRVGAAEAVLRSALDES